jgi:hypothetical protein
MSANRLGVFLCIAILYLSATALPAQSTPTTQNNPPLVTSMTLEDFQQRVQALGFITTRGNKDGKPDTFFTFMAEGRKIGGLMVGPSAIELFVSFTDGAKVEDLNDWNRTHLGNAAFIAQNGNAILRWDLFLDGGVTDKSLNSFITRFRDSAVEYGRFVVDHNKKKP